jgi:hypothetical protein
MPELRILETVQNQRLNRKEQVHVDNDGTVRIHKTLDAEPIIEAVRMSSEIETPHRNNRGMLHLGSIDPLTAANWARESGAAIGTKEFAAYAKKKLQSGDFAHFKVKRKRRYV